MPYYLDASAAVRLVLTETESTALREWLDAPHRELISGDVLRTELLRATVRGAPEFVPQAQTVLQRLVTLLPISSEVFDRAGLLTPPELRSLDALHLAMAIDLRDELQGLISYDERLSRAAASYGIEVLAPS
jgi:uncharacterized protein